MIAPSIRFSALAMTAALLASLWGEPAPAKDGGSSGGHGSSGGNSGGSGGSGNSGSGAGGSGNGGSGSGSGASGSSASGKSGASGAGSRKSDDTDTGDGSASQGSAGAGSDLASSTRDQDAARDAVLRGSAVPLSRLLPTVRRSVDGDVLDVRLHQQGGTLVYDVTVLSKTGEYRSVVVDARRNRVLGSGRR